MLKWVLSQTWSPEICDLSTPPLMLTWQWPLIEHENSGRSWNCLAWEEGTWKDRNHYLQVWIAGRRVLYLTEWPQRASKGKQVGRVWRQIWVQPKEEFSVIIVWRIMIQFWRRWQQVLWTGSVEIDWLHSLLILWWRWFSSIGWGWH